MVGLEEEEGNYSIAAVENIGELFQGDIPSPSFAHRTPFAFDGVCKK